MHFECTSRLWLIEIGVGLFVICFFSWILKRIVHRFREKFNHLQGWKYKLDWIVISPLRLILWAVGVTYIINILNDCLGIFAPPSFISHLRNAAVIFALSWMVFRWKNMKQEALLERCKSSGGKLDPATIQIIFKCITIAILVLTILIMLQIFGVNVIPLLAFGGIGAAAIGFAAKDVIANFFGGFMLLIQRPFVEGERISLHGEKIDGLVEKIGWNTTILRDKNKCPISLPNGLFSNALIINHSRMTHRPIEEMIYFRYEDADKIPDFVEKLQKKIASHPEIDANEPILIGIESGDQHALHVNIRLYTRAITDIAFIRVRQAILLAIYTFLGQNKMEMPLPTQVVKIVQT